MTNYMDQQPVRRGRPRASYAEMGEFDLSLIREFRSRPELYDRNSPLFKDKVLSAQRWQEISNKLGFAVALLKDRMLQLRNRYNIEKRRIEQLREENPHLGETEASPWPLFEHLQFLSDHIRPRRSYKRLVPNVSGYEQEEDYRPDDDNGGTDSRKHSYSSTEMTAPYFANVEVKEENDSDQPSDDEGDSAEEAEILSPANMLPPQIHNSAPHSPEKSVSTVIPTSITIRRLDTLRDGSTTRMPNTYTPKQTYPTYIPRHHQQQHQQQQQQQPQPPPAPPAPPAPPQQQQLQNNNHYQHQQHQQYSQQSYQQQQQQQQLQRHHTIQQQHQQYGNNNKRQYYDNTNRYYPQHAPQQTVSNNNSNNFINPAKRLRLDVRGHKYTAFGYFLSSLLEELPQEKALELVQKFTCDLVQVARTSATRKSSKPENGTTAAASDGAVVGISRSLSVGSNSDGDGSGIVAAAAAEMVSVVVNSDTEAVNSDDQVSVPVSASAVPVINTASPVTVTNAVNDDMIEPRSSSTLLGM